MAVPAPVTTGVLVNEKDAGVSTPATVAVMVNGPAVALAINVGAVATPPASVCTDARLPNVPLAPKAGALNVTVTPAIKFPPASLTIAFKGVPNAALTAALCPEPCVAKTVAGAPAVFVKLKTASVPTPAALAVTE